jgi:hypothetical protein
LIREGSGYWRYVPTGNGLRFFTWYDYEVRFGGVEPGFVPEGILPRRVEVRT